MGTLQELLEQLNEGTSAEVEKTASEKSEVNDEEAQSLLKELEDNSASSDLTESIETITKEADSKEGGTSMTLTDLYNEITANVEVSPEMEKVAAAEAEEIEKEAAEQVTAGRFLALGFMDELQKLAAVEETAPAENTKSEVPAQMESNHPGKEPLAVAGESKKEYYSLVQKKIDEILSKKIENAGSLVG